MVFTSPPHLPKLPAIPDSVPVGEFLYNEKLGRMPFEASRDPYICGITGESYSTKEVALRVDHLARAISARLNFSISEGTEWDRMVCIYSLNTIDYIPLTHAVHRASGIVTPASAAFSHQELEQQIRASGAIAMFTCVPLLENALAAAEAAGISKDRVFILSLPKDKDVPFTTVAQLITEGKSLPALPPLNWYSGQAKTQTAFLSYSSGTSGAPKGVMVSHYNLIANILQISTLESLSRQVLGIKTQVALGALPSSHIYGLTVIGLLAPYRGDQVVVLPKFDFDVFLAAVQRFKIQQLNVVPPILVQILNDRERCARFSLDSVRIAYSGAAPLGKEVVSKLNKIYPTWHVTQGYGMTEASPGVATTSETDCLTGSVGYLLPGTVAKIVDSAGQEVIEYDKPGELLVQSPSVTLGYFNNERATAETFVCDETGRWLKTGDEVIVHASPTGYEHIVVVDRIKELIKVKGHQVAPAELEAHLLQHDFVADCAVISIPDDRAGERPKAYVVRHGRAEGQTDADVAAAVCKHVEDHKASYKWLKGGVEFVNEIPKSASGKILRRLLKGRDQSKAKL